eukprot:g19583.t1
MIASVITKICTNILLVTSIAMPANAWGSPTAVKKPKAFALSPTVASAVRVIATSNNLADSAASDPVKMDQMAAHVASDADGLRATLSAALGDAPPSYEAAVLTSISEAWDTSCPIEKNEKKKSNNNHNNKTNKTNKTNNNKTKRMNKSDSTSGRVACATAYDDCMESCAVPEVGLFGRVRTPEPGTCVLVCTVVREGCTRCCNKRKLHATDMEGAMPGVIAWMQISSSKIGEAKSNAAHLARAALSLIDRIDRAVGENRLMSPLNTARNAMTPQAGGDHVQGDGDGAIIHAGRGGGNGGEWGVRMIVGFFLDRLPSFGFLMDRLPKFWARQAGGDHVQGAGDIVRADGRGRGGGGGARNGGRNIYGNGGGDNGGGGERNGEGGIGGNGGGEWGVHMVVGYFTDRLPRFWAPQAGGDHVHLGGDIVGAGGGDGEERGRDGGDGEGVNGGGGGGDWGVVHDYRTGDDLGSDTNCVNADELKTRYMQIEAFDLNKIPWLKVTFTQVTDECGVPISNGFSRTMEYNANEQDEINDDDPDGRLIMEMFICAPWGNYEYEMVVKSSNDGAAMEKVSWEIEYGPPEYHIWDSDDTPFFTTANGATPSEYPYAPIPNEYTGGDGTTFTWPYPEAEGYYSVFYSGPFPPLECSNLHPGGVEYVGCYKADQPGWTTADGPTGSTNNKDPAELYRMFDGIGDDGLDADGVMNIEKCAEICSEYSYFGLESAIKCVCGNSVEGNEEPNCGVEGDDNIPEYKYLCSGDSRVLCGTDDFASVYTLDGSVPPPPSPTPAPTPAPFDLLNFELLGCSVDSDNRVMEEGPYVANPMSAEICWGYCAAEDKDFEYFGTQYGEECFCAKTLSDTVSLDYDGCDYSCAGKESEICGGYYAISVYDIKPFVVLGCRADADDRIMGEIEEISFTEMTAEYCYEVCVQDGTNTHFGTQYGRECWCVNDPTLGSINKYIDEPAACNYPCTGDADEFCGGSFAMNVFEIDGTVTPAPTAPDTLAPVPGPIAGGDGYSYVGCRADDSDDRVMGGIEEISSKMTTELCFDICSQDGANTHFGTQYGVECFCVDDPELESINKYIDEPTACDYECPGDSGEYCGGYDALSVYEIRASPFTELDCFNDPRDERIMEFKMETSSSTTMSAQVCYEMCVNEGAGYAYFGLQYSYECWCSTTIASSATTGGATCDYPCSNNQDETCGGYYTITAYEIN